MHQQHFKNGDRARLAGCVEKRIILRFLGEGKAVCEAPGEDGGVRRFGCFFGEFREDGEGEGGGLDEWEVAG